MRCILNYICKNYFMKIFSKDLTIRWSDLDPNFHLRHSVYYDFGAYCRISFFTESGFTPTVMLLENIGPIIFREECVFKKEIKFGDKLSINLLLDKCNTDFSHWSIIHEIWRDDETLCAIITVDGAWIDTQKRKLTVPSNLIKTAFDEMVKTPGFKLIEKNN